MNGSDDSLEVVLRDGNVAFFDCDASVVPDTVREKHAGRTKLYSKDAISNRTGVLPYERVAQIREEHSDVYFVDRGAAKVLFADFPATAQFVLIRCVPRASWLLAVPGLLRRMYVGLVRVRGIVALRSGTSTYKWLLVEHKMRESHNPRLCLSEEIGVRGFIDFLNTEHIRYVVLRFFDTLPQLNRIGGDLDILVSDEDDAKLRAFLQAHPGPIGVDVWTVSRASHGAITYYPPPLARTILDGAVEGPAGARIPAPRESFLALAYHVLYHKGAFAGVPSELNGIDINRHPENDYKGTLEHAAKKAGIDIDITMESLDEYLAAAGWRPKLDTLAKIAPRNQWVWKRYFSGEAGKEIGLGVVIIKKKAVELGVADEIERRITESGEFAVLRKRIFSDEQVSGIADQLRGGVWNEKGGVLADFLPAIALVIVDLNLAESSKRGISRASAEKGIKALKGRLRGEFKTQNGNLIHSTDNTHEAGEYIEVCFPGETDKIREEAEQLCWKQRGAFVSRVRDSIIRAPRVLVYTFVRLRQRLGRSIMRMLMR